MPGEPSEAAPVFFIRRGPPPLLSQPAHRLLLTAPQDFEPTGLSGGLRAHPAGGPSEAKDGVRQPSGHQARFVTVAQQAQQRSCREAGRRVVDDSGWIRRVERQERDGIRHVHDQRLGGRAVPWRRHAAQRPGGKPGQ